MELAWLVHSIGRSLNCATPRRELEELYLEKSGGSHLTDQLVFGTTRANGRDFRNRHTEDIRPERGGFGNQRRRDEFTNERASDIALEVVRSSTPILAKGYEAKGGERRLLTLGLQAHPLETASERDGKQPLSKLRKKGVRMRKWTSTRAGRILAKWSRMNRDAWSLLQILSGCKRVIEKGGDSTEERKRGWLPRRGWSDGN